MNDNLNIDELLNGFIDGELSPRQVTEVHRLATKHKEVAKRMEELQRYKLLVGSLPREQAPEEMLEEIKESLERRLLLDAHSLHLNAQKGRKNLLLRKVASVAAMVILVAILVLVIYSVIGPERDLKTPVALEYIRIPEKIAKQESGISIVADKQSRLSLATAENLEIRLELSARDFSTANGFLKKVLENNGLIQKVWIPVRGDNINIYSVSCNLEKLNVFLADMDKGWYKFDRARLLVNRNKDKNVVAAERISPEQISEIVNQKNSEQQIRVARNISILNDMSNLFPGRKMLTAIDDGQGNLLVPPKPVLTSGKKDIRSNEGLDKEIFHLTIVINRINRGN